MHQGAAREGDLHWKARWVGSVGPLADTTHASGELARWLTDRVHHRMQQGFSRRFEGIEGDQS